MSAIEGVDYQSIERDWQSRALNYCRPRLGVLFLYYFCLFNQILGVIFKENV